MSNSRGFLSLYNVQLIDDTGNPTRTTNTPTQNGYTTNNQATYSSGSTTTTNTPTQNPSTTNTQTTSSTGTTTGGGSTETQPRQILNPYAIYPGSTQDPYIPYSQSGQDPFGLYPDESQDSDPSAAGYGDFVPQSAEDEGIPWLTLFEDFLGVIIFFGLVFLCFLGYVLYQKKYQNLVEEYASNPESQIKKQELTSSEKQHLAQWVFNPPEDWVPGVLADLKESRLGSCFEVKFTPSEGSENLTRTIRSNKMLEKNKENCYFEFEIEEADEDADIVIGIGTKDEFNKAVLPGDQRGSIGFHSKGGLLKINGTEVNAYTLDAKFGETIGLGYNFETSRIYLFHNAKYLNEPPREFGSPSKEKSKEKDQSPSPTKAGERQNKIDLEIEKKNYYPMIGATRPCKILLNIGGSPFSIHHKEIAKGLL